MSRPRKDSADTTAPFAATVTIKQKTSDGEWYWSISPTGRRKKVKRQVKR